LRVLSFILLLVIVSITYSCEEQDNYSEIPVISFNSFTVNYKTYPGPETKLVGTLKFGFVDGDGNIGFKENNDTIPDNNIIDILITEFYKKDGLFVQQQKGPYALPYFDDKVYRKTVKGDIEVYFIREGYSPDTVYYECYIIDRDYNQSNIITTDTIIYSEYFK